MPSRPTPTPPARRARRWAASALALAGCAGDEALRVCPEGDAEFASLAVALAEAPDGATLELCPGVHRGGARIVRPVRLRGGGDPGEAVIEGGGVGSALEVVGASDVVLERLALRGGEAAQGGGVRCEAATLTLRDALVTDNRADTGAGLFARDCALTVEGGRFTLGEAIDGGAIAVTGGVAGIRGVELVGNRAGRQGGALHLAGDATVEDAVIADNDSGWIGGGVYVAGRAITLRGNTIRGNRAVEEGGGVYLHEGAPVLRDNAIELNVAGDDGGGVRVFTARARLVGNRLERNRAGGDGGGAKISHLPAELLDNTIVDNEADHRGGGLELDNDSSVVRGGEIAGNRADVGGGVHAMLLPWHGGAIEGVRLIGNQARRGGAIAVEDNFTPLALRGLVVADNRADRGGGLHVRGAEVEVRHTIFDHNEAERGGGAIHLDARQPWTDCPCPPQTSVAIAFAVLHANRADDGGAIWTEIDDLRVENSILAANDAPAVAVEDARAPIWRYNDTWPDEAEAAFDPRDAIGNLSVEPGFVDAAGGDFRLAPTSACVDAGDPAVRDDDGSRADLGAFGGEDAP